MVAASSLLAFALVLHGRLVQTCHRERAATRQQAATQEHEPAGTVGVPPASDEQGQSDQEGLVPAPADMAAVPEQALAPEPTAEAASVEPAPAAIDQHEPEAPAPPAQADAPTTSSLDFAALSERLVGSTDPLAELKRFVGDIRTREAERGGAEALPPCELERYAARMLDEAGLFSRDVELPSFDVVRPQPSHAVYLRISDQSTPYLARQRVLRIESALNAIRFAAASLSPDATQEEAYRLNQGLARSIVAQAAPIDEPLLLEDVMRPEGEWAVRYGISQAIETLQLPHRLTARFRTNVADGNVAIEVDLPPADAFPSSCLVDDLGIVPTTGDMRQRAMADYALRLAILLAASAFRCSRGIRHVWVAGIVETATRRTCYYAIDFDRYRFARLDLACITDLAETLRSFAPNLRYEDGWLRPVRQTFHLGEERFCPRRRYLPVSLSSRRLDASTASSLGTDHVSGLSIEEGDNRTLVANAIMMRLAPADGQNATSKNVRTVMDLAADDPDPTVRTAAERVIRGLVDGTLQEDPYAIGEEFVRGDALTRACDRAKELIMSQRAPEAQRTLKPVLDAIDQAGLYADTSTIVYRFFASYVDRALYNRLYAPGDGGRALILVPDAYYEAHLLMSVCCLMQGRHDEALAHAERLVELSPLDGRARLHLVKCLEELGRDDEAIEQLKSMLEEGHDPYGIGFGYYRMAFFQWKRGNVVAAQACYQSAMRFVPTAIPMMAMELSVLYLQNSGTLGEEASGEEAEAVLEAYDIPVSPTDRTSEVFYECAQASLDAEVFPVARNFAAILGAFSGDDIITGLVRSLEDAPDW